MKNITAILVALFLSQSTFGFFTYHTGEDEVITSRQVYDQIGEKSLSFEAFDLAYRGWIELTDSLSIQYDFLTIVDFSQPSTKKRFYLIDMKKRLIVHQEYVAHGKNSGDLWAENFSNTPKSNQSSLGFYKTAETYHGKHGLSLKLDGLEKGINHLARKRAIVIHSADYAEEAFIKKYGRLGRSFGCPALPSKNYAKIINRIKEGTLLFVYATGQGYVQNSTVLN